MSLRLSIAILPIYRWAEGRKVWKGAEEVGFHAAYTYDHLSWRVPFRDRTWFGALPTLTAAAGVTESIRLGTSLRRLTFGIPFRWPRKRLAAALTDASRDPGSMPRILLTGFTPDRTGPFQSVNAFVDFAGRHAEAGIDEIVVHWPIPGSDFAYNQETFERIAVEAPGQLS